MVLSIANLLDQDMKMRIWKDKSDEENKMIVGMVQYEITATN